MNLVSIVKKYFQNIGVSLSQFGNVVLLFGDPDESMSSRIGKWSAQGYWVARAAAWVLGLVDRGHCADAAEYDQDEGKDNVFPE
jgi:hypothetical protein